MYIPIHINTNIYKCIQYIVLFLKQYRRATIYCGIYLTNSYYTDIMKSKRKGGCAEPPFSCGNTNGRTATYISVLLVCYHKFRTDVNVFVCR